MDDAAIRLLCNELFDAIDRADFDAVERLVAPDCIYWNAVTAEEHDRAGLLALLRRSAADLRRRTYDGRSIHTDPYGFLMQYELVLVSHQGTRTSLWGAMAARCFDGKVVRIDEYLDANQFDRTQLFAAV